MVMNKKGFSLIELMVVVAIIAILATIAVPSYQSFQAKARQKEGFGLLGGYHQSATASFAELGFFPGNFVASGFKPVGQLGYRLVVADFATNPPFGANEDGCVSTAAACATNGYNTWTEVGGALGATIGAVAPATAPAVTGTTFTAVTAGVISISGAANDEYTMNQNKLLTMITDGVN